MTHTPGPWHITEGHEHSEDCPLNVWSPDGRIVAAIVGQGEYLLDDPTDEGRANAHLIAAAPDLYDALRVLVRELKLGRTPLAADIQAAVNALSKGDGE